MAAAPLRCARRLFYMQPEMVPWRIARRWLSTPPGRAALAREAETGCAPVTLVELLRGVDAAVSPDAEVVLDLTPHATHSVLLGDPDRHAFDRILWRRFPSAASAHDAVARLASSAGGGRARGSLVLRVDEAAGFSALPPAAGSAPPLDTAPAPGAPSRCPYVSDPTSQPSSWAALHGRETASPGPMVAFNLLRIAGPAVSRRYQEFSAHFSDLPAKYGLKVLAAADVPPPERSVLLGDLAGSAGCTKLVAVGFPSSRVFASAWSDEAIVRAFPLREQMWADGFEHVWLRCDEEAISNT